MVYMDDVKDMILIALLVIVVAVVCISLYLAITYVEIQIARWMGIDPIWVVGH